MCLLQLKGLSSLGRGWGTETINKGMGGGNELMGIGEESEGVWNGEDT